jgi:putative ATPase
MVESAAMDLFDHALRQRMRREAPLAARMRPRTLAEFAGQTEIVGPGRLLRRAIESDRLFSSILLWGPPGSGKTTLAMIIANTTRSHFETISAVLAGKSELRQVIEAARERRKLHTRARSCSSTRSTAGTRRSRTPCCRMSRMGPLR